MHELAVALGVIGEAGRVAALHEATAIERIRVRVGALSGVEPPLLERAFEVARAGTLAGSAALEIEVGGIRVRCKGCGAESDAVASKIVCGCCGDWRVQVVAGEELLLLRVELAGIPDAPSLISSAGARD